MICSGSKSVSGASPCRACEIAPAAHPLGVLVLLHEVGKRILRPGRDHRLFILLFLLGIDVLELDAVADRQNPLDVIRGATGVKEQPVIGNRAGREPDVSLADLLEMQIDQPEHAAHRALEIGPQVFGAKNAGDLADRTRAFAADRLLIFGSDDARADAVQPGAFKE